MKTIEEVRATKLSTKESSGYLMTNTKLKKAFDSNIKLDKTAHFPQNHYHNRQTLFARGTFSPANPAPGASSPTNNEVNRLKTSVTGKSKISTSSVFSKNSNSRSSLGQRNIDRLSKFN